MGTNTLARGTTFAFGSGFGFQPNMYRKDSGVLILERLAMFRSGTFRDSTGYQMTYDPLHMKQIVDNYEWLRDKKIFDDIPVRDGHPGWLIHGLEGNGKVVGWHDKVWTETLTAPHDDTEYDYILADIRITDPSAAASIENGTWRNRSAEIGRYTTNTEAEFWPVYMGVAYVDIPAVEGLKFSSSNTTPDRQVYVFMDSKETGVGTEPTTTTGQPQGTPLLGVTPAPQAFSINGQSLTDPVVVQNHITALEKFQAETVEGNRVAFVTGLAASNKILATQVDSLTAFAKGLNGEQFVAWQATFEAAPVQPVLGQHASGTTNPENTAQNQPTAAPAQEVTDLEVVKMHKHAGTPKAQIEAGASYKRLQAAGKAPVL
jgi:hypothetical protein